jgi:hypothetical protein
MSAGWRVALVGLVACARASTAKNCDMLKTATRTQNFVREATMMMCSTGPLLLARSSPSLVPKSCLTASFLIRERP